MVSNQINIEWPTANLNNYFSATGCPIGLKPNCIFNFVCCLEVYKKNLSIWTLEGPWFETQKYFLSLTLDLIFPSIKNTVQFETFKFLLAVLKNFIRLQIWLVDAITAMIGSCYYKYDWLPALCFLTCAVFTLLVKDDFNDKIVLRGWIYSG